MLNALTKFLIRWFPERITPYIPDHTSQKGNTMPVIQVLLEGLLEAPELISAVQDDYAAFKGGTLSEADLLTKWNAMMVGYKAAVAKFQAA